MFDTTDRSILVSLATAATWIAVSFATVIVWAIGPAQIDDFEDRSTMGWTEDVSSSNPPVNVPTSGPRGVGDAYLENSSGGGGGAGSRLVTYNRTQWAGDFSSAGVTSVKGHFVNLGADPLPLRVGVEGAAGGRYVTASAAVLPADSTWHELLFELSDVAMTSVGSSQTLASVLTGVTELRVLASSIPDWIGDPLVATLGMDNVAVGSLIFRDGFDSGGFSLWSQPAVANDVFTVVAQVPLSIPAAGVLGNDPWPGYSQPSAVLVSPPANPNSSVALNPDGSFVYSYDAPLPYPVEDTFDYRADSGLDGVATVTVAVLPEPTLTDIRVFYRLDPWLIPGSYGSGIWVSPESFGPVRQTGDVFVLELRADAVHNGSPVPAVPTWIAEDPSMVTTSPSHGDHVTMTIWAVGESSIVVDSHGVRSSMTISATRYQGTAMEVVIHQP